MFACGHWSEFLYIMRAIARRRSVRNNLFTPSPCPSPCLRRRRRFLSLSPVSPFSVPVPVPAPVLVPVLPTCHPSGLPAIRHAYLPPTTPTCHPLACRARPLAHRARLLTRCTHPLTRRARPLARRARSLTRRAHPLTRRAPPLTCRYLEPRRTPVTLCCVPTSPPSGITPCPPSPSPNQSLSSHPSTERSPALS